MLRIEIQADSGIATLYCRGRIVYGIEIETLRAMARSRPEPCLRVDLANVEMVDASGLGLLVELQHWAARNGRALTFQNASDFVGRLITITRLNEVLCVPVVASFRTGMDCKLSSALTA